jgi:hypothetical protein
VGQLDPVDSSRHGYVGEHNLNRACSRELLQRLLTGAGLYYVVPFIAKHTSCDPATTLVVVHDHDRHPGWGRAGFVPVEVQPW